VPNADGVVSERLSNTLISPPFSATNTVPSGANSMFTGLVRPLQIVSSVKPCGRVAASADVADRPRMAPRSPVRMMAARIRCLSALCADRRMAHPLER
jgi:hypothetical protein